tara:strand:+ start:2962 stop:3744 length:783 start_codon:yes stop_codon:yes gene_type:complete
MKSPLVSVIVNCHNGQKYLSECVRSILNQTYKNFEIIFWDNYSTDTSYEIIKKFKDKRIRKFRLNKFNSLYKSRNLAISMSKGKYLTFCDTDDLWTKNKLIEQLRLFNRSKHIKFVFSNYFVLNENKKIKYIKFKKKLPEGFITQDLLNNYMIGILTIMLDKKILEKKSFNPKLNIIGDLDLFIKLSTKFKFYYIQKPLAVYRIHKFNLSSNRLDIYINELEEWIKINSKNKFLKNHSFLKMKYLLYKLKVKYFFKKYFN